MYFCRHCDRYCPPDHLDAQGRHRCGQPVELLRPVESRALAKLALNGDRRKLERAYRIR